MAYTVTLATKTTEAQVEALTAGEFDALMEVFETLRLVPNNGEKLKRTAPDGTAMRLITHRGLEVIYLVIEHAAQVVVIRVNRLPNLED